MLNIMVGDKLEVFDLSQTLIGSGTFKRKTLNVEDKLTVYECDEASIIAEGEHLVKVNEGELLKVSEPKTW